MLLGPTFTCCLSLFYVEDTPTAVLVRQALGALSRSEKARTVAKLATEAHCERQVWSETA